MDIRFTKQSIKRISFGVLGSICAVSLMFSATKAQSPYDVSGKTKNALKPASDNRSDFEKQFSYIPMKDWKRGMRFMVEADDNDFGNELPLTIYHFDSLKSALSVSDLTAGGLSLFNPLHVKDFSYKTFTYDTVEVRPLLDIEGKPMVSSYGPIEELFVIFNCEGKKYVSISIEVIEKLF